MGHVGQLLLLLKSFGNTLSEEGHEKYLNFRRQDDRSLSHAPSAALRHVRYWPRTCYCRARCCRKRLVLCAKLVA
eukprot:3344547-Rhodomonas_salina.1